jgi:hypothetical protein
MSKDVAEQPIALTFKEKDKMNQEMEDDIWDYSVKAEVSRYNNNFVSDLGSYGRSKCKYSRRV